MRILIDDGAYQPKIVNLTEYLEFGTFEKCKKKILF